MIYSIFESVFQSAGNPRLVYSVAVILIIYGIHIGLLLLSLVYQKSYSYIYRGKRTIGNKWFEIFTAPTRYGIELNGWYKSTDIGVSEVWRYREFKDGVEINHQDSEPSEVQPKPARFSELCPHVFTVLMPLPIAISLLLIEAFPILATSIAAYYVVLRLARKAVDLAQSLSEHITDKKAHVGGEG